ncbi:MAG: hypothetical protein U0X91_15345, partial [Spirosomataceae bacterium]
MKPILFAVLCLVANAAFSQKIIEKKFPWSSSQTANLNLKFADSIQVRYWDKAEVSVRISVVVNSGRLNDALTVESSSNTNEISLKTDFDKEMLKKGKVE